MISNPCRWFINGSETKSFTYEGGSKLFHFSPYDNGLKDSMGCNVVFFADNHGHALDVLKRMFKFRLECAAKYIAHNKDEKYSSHTAEFIEDAKKDRKETAKYLTAIEQNKIKLAIAPQTQFYKIGWASNDTILD